MFVLARAGPSATVTCVIAKAFPGVFVLPLGVSAGVAADMVFGIWRGSRWDKKNPRASSDEGLCGVSLEK